MFPTPKLYRDDLKVFAGSSKNLGSCDAKFLPWMLVLACTWWFDGRPWLADGFQRFYPSPIMKVHESTISAPPYLFHVQSCTYPHALGSLPARPYDVHSRSEPQITVYNDIWVPDWNQPFASWLVHACGILAIYWHIVTRAAVTCWTNRFPDG